MAPPYAQDSTVTSPSMQGAIKRRMQRNMIPKKNPTIAQNPNNDDSSNQDIINNRKNNNMGY